MSPHLAWRSADPGRTRFLRQSASLFSQSVGETDRGENLVEVTSTGQEIHSEDVPHAWHQHPRKQQNNKHSKACQPRDKGQETADSRVWTAGMDIVSVSALRLSSCFSYYLIKGHCFMDADYLQTKLQSRWSRKTVMASRWSHWPTLPQQEKTFSHQEEESEETEVTPPHLRSSDLCVQHARKTTRMQHADLREVFTGELIDARRDAQKPGRLLFTSRVAVWVFGI